MSPCFGVGNLTICRPTVQSRRVKVMACPTCGKRRRMLCCDYEWYGWHVTCLTCGEEWQDGEMMPRPFMPGWRRKNVEAAKAMMKGTP